MATPKRFRIEKTFEFIYERAEGDIVVYAPDMKCAIETIRLHGFLVIDVRKIKQTDETLKERLMKEGGIK